MSEPTKKRARPGARALVIGTQINAVQGGVAGVNLGVLNFSVAGVAGNGARIGAGAPRALHAAAGGVRGRAATGLRIETFTSGRAGAVVAVDSGGGGGGASTVTVSGGASSDAALARVERAEPAAGAAAGGSGGGPAPAPPAVYHVYVQPNVSLRVEGDACRVVVHGGVANLVCEGRDGARAGTSAVEVHGSVATLRAANVALTVRGNVTNMSTGDGGGTTHVRW